MLTLMIAALGLAGPCEAEALPVARAQLSILLDPAGENRTAQTRAVIEQVLVPNKTCEFLVANPTREHPGACLELVITEFWPDSDQVLFADAIDQQVASYKGCLGDRSAVDPIRAEFNAVNGGASVRRAADYAYPAGRTAPAIRERARRLERAVSKCAAGDCRAGELDQLVWSFHPLARPQLDAQPFDTQRTPARKLWLDTHAAATDRADFLKRALALSGSSTSAEAQVNQWAMAEVIGERDPGLWKKDEVALLAESPAAVRARAYRFMGRAIGFRRAFALLKLANLGQTPPPTPSHESAGELLWENSAHGIRNWAHFGLEALVYREEWLQTTPSPETKRLPIERQVRGGMTLAAYSAQRWEETDSRAPSAGTERE